MTLLLKKQFKRTSAIAVVAVLASIGTAQADKANDTLRMAFADSISMVDLIFDLKPETGFTATAVFDTLVYYDDWTHKIAPLLASSWKQIDRKTLEFKLRKDVRFHDGSKFDADDVVYTMNWLTDPKTKFRAKGRASWIKEAIKIDPYTVRVIARKESVVNLMRAARMVPIYPSDTHSKLKDKTKFGRNPIGTGPYKVTQVHPSKGIIMVKNEKYNHGNSSKPPGKIGRIEIAAIPDTQTQIAKLMTGELDVVQKVPKDQAILLAKDPRFNKTISNSLLYSYVGFDAAGRSKSKPLADMNVRRALFHAIDRKSILRNIVPGGESAKLMDSLCHKIETGCAYDKLPPAYDPAKAKKMLAEAGYPNGFPLNITTIGPVRDIAEAVANFLRAVGVKANVDSLTFGAYRKKQGQGKVQGLVSMWSGGGLPDVEPSIARFFNGGGSDMWRDKKIAELRKAGDLSFDLKERKKIYTELLDRVIERGYLMGLTTLPAVFIHTKEVNIRPGALSPIGSQANNISWN